MRSSLLVESRFCRFQVPSSWQVAGRGVAFDDRPGLPACSAVVTESWLDPPVSAQELVARQLELAPQVVNGFEMLRQEPANPARFADGWLAVVRSRAPDGTPLLQHQLTVVSGPVGCCLTLAGTEKDAPEWAATAVDIAESFEVPAAAALARLTREPLLQAADAPAVQAAVLADLQLVVPVPTGWHVDTARCCLRGPANAEIAFRAAQPPGVALDEAFAEALASLLRTPELVLRSWDAGELERGRRWYALEGHVAAARTWGPREPELRCVVFVDDEGVLELHVQASTLHASAKAALATVVQGLRRQPSAERRLRLAEAWLPAVLEGHWQHVAPGLYVHLEAPRELVFAARCPCPRGVRRLAEDTASRWSADPAVGKVVQQELVEGIWKGCNAVRFSLEGFSPEGQPLALRAAWLEGQRDAAFFSVQGPEREGVERLFVHLLEAAVPAQLKGGGEP